MMGGLELSAFAAKQSRNLLTLSATFGVRGIPRHKSPFVVVWVATMFSTGTLVLVLLLTSTLTAQTTPGSASISYPTGNPTFNYIDRVDVTYTTPWSQGVNLSVYCQETASASESPFYYQTYFNPRESFFRSISHPGLFCA
jgi:hypothetical protein